MINLLKEQIIVINDKKLTLLKEKEEKPKQGRLDTVYYHIDTKTSFVWDGKQYSQLSNAVTDLTIVDTFSKLPSTGDVDGLYLTLDSEYIYTWGTNAYSYKKQVTNIVSQLIEGVRVKYGSPALVPQYLDIDTIYTIGYDGRTYLQRGSNKFYMETAYIIIYFTPIDNVPWSDIYGNYVIPMPTLKTQNEIEDYIVNKLKSLIDTNNDGYVDYCKDSEKLNGKSGAYYLNYNNLNNRPNTDELSEKINTVSSQLAEMKKYKSIISFIYDDGNKQNSLTKTIFDSYGYTVDFALITDSIFDISKLPLDNFRLYEKQGSSILSHSATHPNLSNSNADVRVADYEIRSSAKKLRNLGFDVMGYVSGYSETNDVFIPKLKEEYDYAFTVGQYYRADGSAHNLITESPYKLHRLNLTEALSSIQKAVDKVIEQGGWLVFYDHNTGATDSADETKTRQVLDYVKSKVDAGLCTVINSNNAYQAFYGKGKKHKSIDAIGYDVLQEKNMSKWTFSKHNGDHGQVVTDRGGYLELKIPSGTSSGTQMSLQCLFPYSFSDTLYTNEFALEMWGDTYSINVTLEVYYQDATGNVIYYTASPQLISNQVRNIFKFKLSPVLADMTTIKNVKIFPRITVNNDLTSDRYIYFANPYFKEIVKEFLIPVDKVVYGTNYIKHPNGLLEAWGEDYTSPPVGNLGQSKSVIVPYAISIDNVMLTTRQGSLTDYFPSAKVTNKSAGSFDYITKESGTYAVQWRVMGKWK